jgi:serine/threonine protein kinase
VGELASRNVKWSLLNRIIFTPWEFVEGEMLENLIKRSGQLEAKLALEIATLVTAGLAAVHKQKLVHRDIKPTNIMVGLDEGHFIQGDLAYKKRRETFQWNGDRQKSGSCQYGSHRCGNL